MGLKVAQKNLISKMIQLWRHIWIDSLRALQAASRSNGFGNPYQNDDFELAESSHYSGIYLLLLVMRKRYSAGIRAIPAKYCGARSGKREKDITAYRQQSWQF